MPNSVRLLRLPALPIGPYQVQLVIRFERSAEGLVDALATAEAWRRLRQMSFVQIRTQADAQAAVHAVYGDVYPKLTARGLDGWRRLAETMLDELYAQLGESITGDPSFDPYQVQPGETLQVDFLGVDHGLSAEPKVPK